MPIYMKIGDGPTPTIKGDVTAADHVNWIELQSAQLGVQRQVNPTTTGANREAAAPQMSEIVVTKLQDVASTALFKGSLYGEGQSVQIDFVRTDQGKATVYMSLKLDNVLISNYNVSSTGGDRAKPMESLALNFTHIEWGSVATVTPHTNPTPPAVWK